MSRQNRFPIQGFLSIFCTFFLKSSHCWFPLDKICGQRPIEDNLIPRIIGGESAIFGEIPWQAGLKEHRLFGLLKYRKCGAVVIGDKWLLTAAHCTDTWPFSELIAIVGEHRELKPNKDKTRNPSAMTEHDLIQIRKVKRTIVHPKFNPTLLEDDLALLELEKPLRFDMNIQPICLPFRHDNFTLHDGFVSGWGFTKYRAGPLPKVLQVVKLPIMSNESCRKMYSKAGFQKRIPPTVVCAGYAEGGKDSCEGDSGGPLMAWNEARKSWVLVGIVSNGIRCAEPNLPGVYVRITEYLDWILQNVVTL